MINVHKTIEDLLSRPTVDQIFLPAIFAGYSVNTVNKNSYSSLSLTRYFCNGLNGALVYESLVTLTPFIIQGAKPLMNRIASQLNECTLTQLTTLCTMSYEVLTNISSYPLILAGFALGALIFYRQKLQILFAIVFSAITAKFVVNCLNNLASNHGHVVDQVFLSTFFAHYAVDVINKIGGNPKSFTSNFCNGFNGALIYESLVTWSPVITQYVKPLMDHIASQLNEDTLTKLTLNYKISGMFTNISSYPILLAECMFFVLTSYRNKMQVLFAIIFSAITARFVVNCLNNLDSNLDSLFYILYLIYLVFPKWRSSTEIYRMFPKWRYSTEIKVSFFEKQLIDLCEAVHLYQTKKCPNKSLKDKATIAIIEARNEDANFKNSTDAFIKSSMRNEVGIGNGTIKNNSPENQATGGMHRVYRAKNTHEEWSPQKIVEFLNSQPSKKELMYFCEAIYRTRIVNSTQQSVKDQFLLAVMDRRVRYEEFRLSTDPYFEEIFDGQVCETIDCKMERDLITVPDLTIKDFMNSKPTKKDLIDFIEWILAIKIMNKDNHTWQDTIFKVGIYLRKKLPLVEPFTNYVAVENLFDQQVCNKIYSFINQEKQFRLS